MDTKVVPVSALKKIIDPYKKPAWGFRTLRRSMVTSATESNQLLATSVPNNAPILIHAKRVAYFVVHGWEIPITVLVSSPDGRIKVIFNGLHRLAAAIYLHKSEVMIQELTALDYYASIAAASRGERFVNGS